VKRCSVTIRINRTNKSALSWRKYRLVYRSAGKSLARRGTKQATATEDFYVHISYLSS